MHTRTHTHTHTHIYRYTHTHTQILLVLSSKKILIKLISTFANTLHTKQNKLKYCHYKIKQNLYNALQIRN